VKTKPIKVDWEELESAFDSGSEELTHFLDRITGHVVLEGEGEEDDFDDTVAVGSQALEDRTRLSIEPVKTAQKIDWIKRFLDETTDLEPEFRDELKKALAAENVAAALTEVLHQSAEGSDRWYLYRTDRLRELIEDWLEGNGVAVANPPPWKKQAGDQPS
jgi:hypothetical protein